MDDPVDVGGVASTVRSIQSIREWSMVGVVCDTTIFIDHAPAGPARASTAEGRAQQAGSARRARELDDKPNHLRAAAGGALIP